TRAPDRYTDRNRVLFGGRNPPLCARTGRDAQLGQRYLLSHLRDRAIPPQLFFDALAQRIGAVGLAVDEKGPARWRRELFQPAKEFALIRVGGEHVEIDHFG